jgi:hypothetical protein
MSEQVANVITIDGKEYKEKDLDAKQKYLKDQIQDLQAKSTQLRFQLDQVTVAQNAFTNSLLASLKETMDSFKDSEEEKSKSQNAG